MTLSRRSFLAGAAAAATPGFWQWAYGGPARSGAGPYGPLRPADANGLMLPAGFRSRVVGRSGLTVQGTGRIWHGAPDGGATFPTPESDAWVYVSNSEAPAGLGGASAIRFDSRGTITQAYAILTGTTGNCAGGPTPWGTWLSCEETDTGRVWECDPFGLQPAVARPAMGVFAHEAAAVDPTGHHVYLTEDKPDGRLYRFTPSRWPDLGAGSLEAAVVTADRVTWVTVPDPRAASVPTRHQVPRSTSFSGGEGIWWADGTVWFTTKGDNHVRAIDTVTGRMEVVYDPASAGPDAPLSGVDNIVAASPSGDLYVAEDGGNMELVVITSERVVAPFLRLVGHDRSELTGPAFDPSGSRLYFSSQRGVVGQSAGVTFEVRGPFRRARSSSTSPSPTTTIAAAATSGRRDDDTPRRLVGAAGVAAAVGAALAVRRRHQKGDPT
ncbi:MAG TPA: alkaline phosphatase PhoX [Acidimicrobiales bacterium]|nr:alkaline phosphatase PhoX [Acidimicrobiales bacterium]